MAANSSRPAPWQTLVKLVAALIAAGVLVAGLALPYVGGIGLLAGHEADRFSNTTCNLQESKPPQRTTILARDGKTQIATLFSQDRVPVPLSQVPKYLQEALIATEDRRFYHHHGVDWHGLLRSAVNTTSGDTQGGSTLTMQYVKQIRYYQAGDDEKKQEAAVAQNLNRKIEDAKCALYLENTLHESKSTILTNYLNIAFFGEHSYGIQTAAETYFNKPASKLTLAESALLVGMLRAPSAYDPFLNRAAAKQRRDEVLQNLVDVGKLSQSEANQQSALPIQLATQSPPLVKQGCANANTTVQNAAFFCEYVQNWLTSVDKITENQLQTGGLKIVTTLDPQVQDSAQKRLARRIPARSPMTAVLPVVDPRTGDILAMASSKTYGAKAGQTEQPIFTKATAQGASTYKLFPLLTALQTGVPSDWTLETADGNGAYKPKYCTTRSTSRNGDANETYSLNETLESATVKSSNTYFVGLADHLFGCQLGPMVDLAHSLGMTNLDLPSEANPKQSFLEDTIAEQRAQLFVLGSIPTSPIEIAGAYAAIANGGEFNAPAPVLSITDSNGGALPVHRVPGKQVVAPQVAAKAVKIMTGDTKSPGTSAGVFDNWYSDNSSEIAGKTGTMESYKKNKNAAVWFVGMTPKLVAASALINFDQSSAPSRGLPHTGIGAAYGDYASDVWLDALKPTIEKRDWSWPDPDTIGSVDVPSVVGKELGDARRTLTDAGFKMRVLGGSSDLLRCPSPVTIDSVAYAGPSRAAPGATITVCKSLGVSQPIYRAPPPVKHHHGGHGGGNGGGGNGGGGNGGGGHGGGHGGPGPGPPPRR